MICVSLLTMLLNLNVAYGSDFISDFSKKNGFKVLTIFKEKEVSEEDLHALVKSLVRSNVAFKTVKNMNDIEELGDRVLYLYQNNHTNLNSILMHCPIKGVIAVPHAKEKTFPEIKQMSHFYWIKQDFDVYHIIKMNDKSSVITNPVVLKSNKIQEGLIDFKGLELRVITLDYVPYLMMNCSEGSESCHCDGYLNDLLNLMSFQLNFTWLCIKEPNNLWGSQRDKDGEYKGTLGALIKKESDLCLATWIRTYDRRDYFDFVKVVTGSVAGCLFLDNKEADYNLFFRPFTIDAWIIVWIISGLVGIYFVLASIKVSNFVETCGHKALITSVSYSFVLLIAYYGGAMTMFFTTEVTVPFETAMDVINNPEWTNIYTAGDKLFLSQRLSPSHEKVKKYWEEVEKDPKFHIVSDLMEGLRRAQRDKVVFFRDITGIIWTVSSLNALKLEFEGMMFIQKQEVVYNSMLPKNSPLTAPMRMSYMSLHERGLQNKIFMNWIKAIQTDTGVQLFTLTEGQMSTLFLWMAAAMVFAIFVLLLEFVYNKHLTRKMKTRMRVPKPIALY